VLWPFLYLIFQFRHNPLQLVKVENISVLFKAALAKLENWATDISIFEILNCLPSQSHDTLRLEESLANPLSDYIFIHRRRRNQQLLISAFTAYSLCIISQNYLTINANLLAKNTPKALKTNSIYVHFGISQFFADHLSSKRQRLTVRYKLISKCKVIKPDAFSLTIEVSRDS
jgi:hypothetical protein